MTEPRDAGAAQGGSWFSGMSWQAQIVMAILVVLVVFLGGLLIGSSGDSEPAAIDFTSSPTSSNPALTAASAATTTTTAAVATTSPSATTTPTPATTAAPTPTTSTTTTTTIPIVLVVEDVVFLEKGHGIDLDTGSVYTFPTNPDQVNESLRAAVDLVLDDVLVGPTGFNVVISPYNDAFVLKQPFGDDSCNDSSGLFGSVPVFVNRTGEQFDGYYCFHTTEGNYSLSAPVAVTGTQDPMGLFFATVEAPGVP